MRRRWMFGMGVLLMAATAAPASADVVVPRRRVRRAPAMVLSSVYESRSSAPEPDARAVTRAVRRGLARRSGRLSRCLADVDLREDPVRRRSRRLVGRMSFSRSGRPEVSIQRARGIPAAARRCVLEVANAITAPAPRGEVVLTFVYAVR